MAFMTIGAPVKLVVRAAKHVMPKATKGHTKTRPIKVRASLMRKDRPPTTLNPEQRRRPAGTGLCAMRFSGELCERRIPTGPGHGGDAGRVVQVPENTPRSGRVLPVPSRTRPSPNPLLACPISWPKTKPPILTKPTLTQNPQHRPSDKIRKKVVYPEIKAEEVPPLMTMVSEK